VDNTVVGVGRVRLLLRGIFKGKDICPKNGNLGNFVTARTVRAVSNGGPTGGAALVSGDTASHDSRTNNDGGYYKNRHKQT
jgi:hypothetical protein